LELQCTNLDAIANSGVTVAVSLGPGANGTATDRQMASSGHLLRYGIYRDAARTGLWGSGMDAAQLSSGALAPHQTTPLHFTLFGRIPAQQNVPAGLYQDQLVLTVTP
jgi:spore coat protein U-like protein